MEDRDRQLIERYLAQDMTVSEKSEFQNRLNHDQAFAQELHAYKNAIEALKLAQRDELKKRFQSRDKILDGGTKHFTLGKGKLWMIAAAITGLIIVSWWLYYAIEPTPANEIFISQDSLQVQDNVPYVITDTISIKSPVVKKEETTKPRQEKAEKENKANELFADNFDPYMDESMDVAMRSGEEGLSALEKFQSHYSFAEFKEAVVVFKQLSDAQQKNDNLRFMYANALMATGKTTEAIPVLADVIANNKSNYVTEAQYYLALSHIKHGNYIEAKKMLNEYIADPGSFLKDKARLLLRALEK